MSDMYMFDSSPGNDDSEIGITTAVEQSTGSKNSRFAGMGRGISVGTYQWVIVVGAIAALWTLRFGLVSA